MVQEQKKRFHLSNKAKTIIAIIVIAIAVALVPFAPPEGESNNTTGDLPGTPTVGITNLLETVTVNRVVTLDGVTLTVTKAMVATKFSDDRKRIGNYTVRVLVLAHNSSSNILGVDYVSLVHLQLPDGTIVPTKYISVKPVSLPKSTQSGFFDFPLTTPLSLSALTLHIGNDTMFALGG